MVKVEVCCSGARDVREAVRGGADRIELCSALAGGGVTPSVGLIREAVDIAGNVPVMVLIRPRDGHFVYDEDEVRVMEADIMAARCVGAYGVVIGALTPTGEIDVDTCRRLVKAAHGMNITFSRAIDVTPDTLQALRVVASLNVDRVLTSGGAANAPEGADVLRQMVQYNGPAIMAGGGVTAGNVTALVQATGVQEVHGSFRQPQAESPLCRALPGLEAAFRHTSCKIVEKVKECVKRTL